MSYVVVAFAGAIAGYFFGFVMGVRKNPRLIDRVLQRKWELEERRYREEMAERERDR